MLDIPKGRKSIRTGRLCVMLGLTLLLYAYVAHRLGEAAEVIVRAVP